jgi:hypothetical protein
MSRKLRFLLFGLAIVLITALVIVFVLKDSPGQYADENFDTRVSRPAYGEQHPKVLFDEAHHNIHTVNGLYSPFASLISNDGYQIVQNKEPFSQKILEGYSVLVIANALGANDTNDSSAFTDAECDAVRDWVQAGGSLLLITDHAPTGAAAENLAKRFNVEMSKGMTEDAKNFDTSSGDKTQLVFTRENNLLGEHPITHGRDQSERVNKVMTFTGQSLKAPEGAIAFLKLGESAMNRAASVKAEKAGGDTRVLITYGDPISASGFAQGVALEVGKGRVVMLGEAAMLTAQIDGKTKTPFGMNVSGVDNRQLALNILHWLSRIL